MGAPPLPSFLPLSLPPCVSYPKKSKSSQIYVPQRQQSPNLQQLHLTHSTDLSWGFGRLVSFLDDGFGCRLVVVVAVLVVADFPLPAPDALEQVLLFVELGAGVETFV